MTRGATPAAAAAPTRASGVNPCRRTPAADARISAAAPSLIPAALPAVIVPPARKGAGSAASRSRLVARGCSSALTTVSPLRPRIVTAAISAACQPASYRACDRNA